MTFLCGARLMRAGHGPGDAAIVMAGQAVRRTAVLPLACARCPRLPFGTFVTMWTPPASLGMTPSGGRPPHTQGGNQLEFTQPYPFCPSFAQGVGGARFRPGWVIAKKEVRHGSVETCRVAVSQAPGRAIPRQNHARFVVVLASSAASMGFAYLGFERVSTKPRARGDP